MGMGRRSRSPNASTSEAPAEKIMKKSNSNEAIFDESCHKSIDDSYTSAPLMSMEAVPQSTPVSSANTSKDVSQTSAKVKRQDWCRWPICKDYYRTGVCPAESGKDSETKCQFAHVREEDGISEIADGYVRVCFDSMGLIQPACHRSKCTYFHPPKHIRDQIIARRHAQYLEEKQAKRMQNQNVQPAMLQMPQAPGPVNPLIYIPDPLTMQYNQLMMYNFMPELAPVSPMVTANRVDPNSPKPGPSPMGLEGSPLAFPQVLQAPAIIPPINWPDYLPKPGPQCISPQRPDAIAQYNWLPLGQMNPSLLGPFIQPPATFAFQTLGPMSPIPPNIGLPGSASMFPCVPSVAQVPPSGAQ